MSLINDALKRASQTDKEHSRPSAVPPGMTAAPAPRRFPVALVLGLVIALLAMGAVWILWRALSPSAPPAPPPSVTIIAHTPAPSTPVAAVAPPAPVIQPPPTAPPAPVSAPPPEKLPTLPPVPALKLQAIFFSRTHPHALINGHTLAEGEVVSEARIVKIAPDRVTLEWNGQSETLQMETP
ncbi:MAG TPA: hypothetical protein VHB20_04305 [Verrucomicrobiae bacterium]|nr:hypothetical protein [Verrucomicrobiae bacterium]